MGPRYARNLFKLHIPQIHQLYCAGLCWCFAIKRPQTTSEALEVNYYEVTEEVCISVGPLKNTSFYEFQSPKS